MRKKDMYLRYDRYNKHSSKGKTVLSVVLLLMIALAVGAGVYFGFKAFNSKDEAVPDETDQRAPVVAAEASQEELTEEVTEAGPYGMWYAAPTEEVPEQLPYTEDVWMADFVDTRERVESKGIYVSSAYAWKFLDKAIALIDRTELNTIVIDIKSDSGYITYEMDYDVAKEIGATSNTLGDIKEFVKMCKDHGIYLIARIVALKDPILAEGKPELALKNQDGSVFRDNSGLAWVNPYKKEVWDYLLEVSKKTAEAGFDEINYDYIRFSTDKGMSSVDFGEEADEMTRIEVITNGIKRMCEELKPLGVFVSCDVYGAIISSSVDAKIVGQSYRKMASYLDYICPMVYPSHYGDGYYKLDYPDLHPYELVMGAMEDSKKVLSTIPEDENKAIVRPWLQDFTASWLKHYQEYGPTQVLEQKNAVYESGYSQWLLWNAACNYSEAALSK